jgi:hypothetical protein
MRSAATFIRAVLFLGLGFASVARADAHTKALTLFREINGVPIALGDARLPQMESLISQGKLADAAAIASTDDHFYNVTLRHWAGLMSNRQEDPNTPFNDFDAMVLGEARDDRDFREILYGDFAYVAFPSVGAPPIEIQNNKHFQFLEDTHANYRQVLMRSSPQSAIYAGCPTCPADPPPPHLNSHTGSIAGPAYPAAGVLTSRTWFDNHLYGGTSRRSVEYTFREFMCTPFRSISDLHVPREHVRQDVSRQPGGNSAVFTTFCVGCHGILDGLAGAFAYFDMAPFDANTPPNALQYKKDGTDAGGSNGFDQFGIAIKNYRNNTVYPDGYQTFDDSFVNYAIQYQNAAFGWRGAAAGNGPSQFGQMIAQSRGFSVCMAKRAYSQLCLKKDFNPERMAPTDMTQLDYRGSDIQNLADYFENNGYNLRQLFEQVAILPHCIGN